MPNITAPAVQSDSPRLTLSGAGNINVNQVATRRLDTTSSGTGNIKLSGQADTQSTTLSGFGEYTAGDLRSNDATFTLTGAGGATVWAEKTLYVKISGAGSVSYYGSPQVTESITGAGR